MSIKNRNMNAAFFFIKSFLDTILFSNWSTGNRQIEKVFDLYYQFKFNLTFKTGFK